MRQPRILWASPFNLLDSTSGASKAIYTILKQLHKNGWETMSICGTVFDDLAGSRRIENERQKLAANTKILDVSCDFMTHKTVLMNSWERMQLTAQSELDFYEHFLATLEHFRPDVIMLYGGYVLDLLVCHEAKSRKIPVVFYLGNAHYLNGAVVFNLVDLIITDTKRTADLYREKLKVQAIPIGAFIDADEVVAETADPKYLTFINPELSKGATVVATLANYFRETMPNLRFLVVQSRGKWIDSLLSAGHHPEEFSNVDVADNVSNMKLVYKVTKALLIPSLAYESAGRVIVEAQMNGIPVIGSNLGGIPQMIGDGGVLLNPPAAAIEDHETRLEHGDISEWIDAVKRLFTDDSYYKELSEAAVASSAKNHNISERTQALIDTLKPLTDRRAGDRPFC